MREFHHFGLPTTTKQPGEVYVPDTKVWVTSPDAHPQRIEFLRFEPDATLTGPVREMPHIAFKTDNLRREIKGQKVLLGPFKPMEGLEVVFILKDGAVFEFMQWS
jgi:hypothetical protein